MDNSAERRSIPADRAKMGFDGLGNRKFVLVKGSGNGWNWNSRSMESAGAIGMWSSSRIS